MFFHPNLLESMPIWFHTGALPSLKKLNNYFYAQCIRDHHNVRTTGEMWALARTPLDNPHQCQSTCICARCTVFRETAGCLKPFKCVETALSITSCIPNKWTPTPVPPRTNPDLSTEEIAESGPIENAFRILRLPTPRTESPATQHTAPIAATHPTVEIVYGSNHRIDDDGARVSSGSAFFTQNDPRNIAFCTTNDRATNDTGLLCAILESSTCLETKTRIGSIVMMRISIDPLSQRCANAVPVRSCRHGVRKPPEESA